MYKFTVAGMSKIFTPLFFVAAGILLALLTYYLIPFCVFLACSVIFAGLGLRGLYCSHSLLVKRGINLIGFGLGLFLGVLFAQCIEYEENYFFTGIALEKVDSFQGYLKADGEQINQDLYLCEVELFSVAAGDNSFRSQAKGKVRVYLKKAMRLLAGEIIEVQGRLRLNQKSTPPSIDSWVNPANIKRHGFVSWIYKARYSAIQWCEARIDLMGEPLSGFFKALFLGNREELDERLKDAFYDTGSAHLLALSGLHVGIVYALMGMLLYPLASKKLKIIIGSILVLGYLFLVGPKPSLLRASLMLITGGAAVLLHRDFNPYNIFFLCLILTLFLDPAAVYTMSFALSYCAVFGILTIGMRLNSFLIPYLPSFLRLPLCLSLSAQAATLPLVLKHFNYLYPLSFLLVLILIPLVIVFIWGGTVFLLFSLIPFAPLYQAFKIFLSFVYELIFRLSTFFSRIPGLEIFWNDWYWIPFIIIMGFLLLRVRLRKDYE
jgi:ComEC/Rec2-related protein